MAVNLGSMVIDIAANVSRLRQDMGKADREIGKFRANAEKHFNSIERVGKNVFHGIAAAAAMVGVKSAIQSIVETGARYEQTMATVKGVSRATSGELERMHAVARKMGRETEFSASQAAEGLKFLSMAGFKAAESVEALPGVLDLATASGLDMGRVADIASNALTGMRLNVEDLGRVNDVFARTITTSNVDMEMLAESFKYAAPVAAAYGYEIETVNALLGLLGNAGIQGSMAGTQLANSFVDVNKAFEHFKVKAGEGTKYSKDLTGALKMLEDQAATNEQVMEIFGERSGRAILALMGMGSKAVEDYIKVINDAEGANSELAATMRNTTANALKEVQSAIESVQITAFTDESSELNRALKNLSATIRENETDLADLAGAFIDVARGAATAAAWVVEFFNETGKGLGEFAGKLVYGEIETYDAEIKKLQSREKALMRSLERIESGKRKLSDDEKEEKIEELQGRLAKVQRDLRITKMAADYHYEPLKVNTPVIPDIGGGKKSKQDSGPGSDKPTTPTSPKGSSSLSEIVRFRSQLTDEIARLTQDETTYALESLERQVAAYREKYGELGVIAEYEAVKRKELNDQVLERQRSNNIAMLRANKQYHDAEILEIEAEKEAFIKAGVDKVTAQEWANKAIAESSLKHSKDWTAGAARAAKEYYEDLTDVSKHAENMVANGARNMEDALINLFKNGEVAVEDFFSTLIEEMARAYIQSQITGPLMEFLGGFLGGMFGGANGGMGAGMGVGPGGTFWPSAHGNVFSGPGISAYSNSIVSSPTFFPFAHGMGLMGEAGAEAIMPLTRGSNGDLGVKVVGGGAGPQQVNVNVYNESGQPVKASNATAQVDMNTMVISIWLDGYERNSMGLRDVVGGAR